MGNRGNTARLTHGRRERKKGSCGDLKGINISPSKKDLRDEALKIGGESWECKVREARSFGPHCPLNYSADIDFSSYKDNMDNDRRL